MRLSWYVQRLARMGPAEIAWRLRNMIVQRAWRRRAGTLWPRPPAMALRLTAAPRPPEPDARAVPALLAAAGDVLAGQWQVFGAALPGNAAGPDWHCDPLTGRRAPLTYFAALAYRDEALVGNVKYLWEVSRLHHVTLLAAAFHASGDPRFAARALADLLAWWRANPPLLGVHWTSGIEIGIRLLAWAWCRRLLAGHPDTQRCFEDNPDFLRQLHAHQLWLVTFRSRFSSANNHLIAEMAGLLAGALAFPCFPQSARWAALAARLLEREAARQSFPDGVNRELASGYQVFVLELLLCAGVEADAAGRPLSPAYWRRVRAMADALAALVDDGLHAPRQGDGDDGRALLLEAPGAGQVAGVLDACARLLGAPGWWPSLPGDSHAAALLAGLGTARRDLAGSRPAARPCSFPAAGLSLLREAADVSPAIWCRFDHGPHGFLSIAAHAHADALSVEVREGGQEILTDPGTYCYHGERIWRDLFRSTRGHNTLEIDGVEQSVAGGPFLWTHQARGRLLAAEGLDGGEVARVSACHDGYRRLPGRPLHHRRVTLDRRTRRLSIEDWIETERDHAVCLAFHLHPDIGARLEHGTAHLEWPAGPVRRQAMLTLPAELSWTLHRGGCEPLLGWYSPGFGRRQPAATLLGRGRPGSAVLTSMLAFHGSADDARTCLQQEALARHDA